MKRLFILFLILTVSFSCQEEITPIVPSTSQPNPDPDDDDDPPVEDIGIGEDNSNVMLGNPSGATADVTNENNYLMNKGYFVLSYNRSRGIPNWVSWYLSSTSLGGVDRTDDFESDSALPASWYHVTHSSYTNSGFTRGHNCPSADRTTTVEANEATFLMTNMIPQAANNNSGLWNAFETYCRNQVNAGNEVYIIMGSYGKGGNGTGNPAYAETIDGGRITVPNRIWKVAVIIPNGNDDLSRVSATTRVIAIDTPNNNTGLGAWHTYRVSVDAIETATGYDLLSMLPDNIETVLEAAVDSGSI